MIKLDWGNEWAALDEGSALQAELDRELHPKHPLSRERPIAFGRCVACDDVVVSLAESDSEIAVVHLTWSGRPEKPRSDGSAWPYFERLPVDDFVARFLRGGEHL